jgi:uncharacterized protein YecE (DUF72 family)
VKAVRVGCSGWNYKHWREVVYPRGLAARRWLERYAKLFDTVEVNATFYRLPTRKAVAGWAEQSPPDFCFAVKGSRYLTHIRRLRDTGAGVARFYACLEPMIDAGKLGPVLWQLPGNFKRDDERLARFLDGLPPGRHTVEFRHESWFTGDVYALLRERRAALTIGDHPERPFQTRELTADWTFVRFHYGRGRGGNYSRRQLEEWRHRIAQWRRRVDVYAYFNNDWEGYAVANGLWLRRALGRRVRA